MYTVIVLIHILAGMVWVGGGFLVVAVQRHASRVGGQQRAATTMSEMEWVDDWIFTPAPLLVVVTGVLMVVISDAWAFSQPWVYLALGLIFVEFVTGVRDVNRLKAAREYGTGSIEFGNALTAYLRFAPVAIAILAAIVVLMVFKPGV